MKSAPSIKASNEAIVAKTKASIHKTIDLLMAYEMDGSRPADGRRTIRNERMVLQSLSSRNPDILAERNAEALRTLALWT